MSTIVDVALARASEHPNRSAYSYLTEGSGEERSLTFFELATTAQKIAARLQERGVKKGERVLLLYPPGLEYVAAFFGCLFAGAAAVPAYPPRPKGPTTRLDGIVHDARPVVAMTSQRILEAVEGLTAGADRRPVGVIATDDARDPDPDAWRSPELSSDTLAFLQYTSGSTAAPKGVMVTHGNLICNQQMIQTAFEHDAHSTFVGWLPMFHDMGLIGNVIHPLFIGASSILMSPLAFIQAPIRWLQAITKYRARTSGAPNFAYDLCVSKTKPDDRENLDLSTWSLAFNGSEPVRSATLDRFVTAFEPVGFRRETFYPCYGLAEATLLVSGSRKSEVPVVRSFSTDALGQGRAVPGPDHEEGQRSLVGCGHTWLDQVIEIVDPDTGKRCPEGRIGEIWVSGSNVAAGYWENEEATSETFGARLADGSEARYLRTGDLGFFDDDELFISSRIKDLIIIRGRNHFPQDIELTVESSHPALRRGCGAAFAVDSHGEERLCVVQEVARRSMSGDLEGVVQAIRAAVTKEHELITQMIALLKPGHVPKTSSGKIQRHACRASYLAGTLDPLFLSELEESEAPGNAPSVGAAGLLRRTLEALGREKGRELMESHLRKRAAALPAGSSFGLAGEALNLGPEALSELHPVVESDLGISVPRELVTSSESLEELSSALIDRLLGPQVDGPTGTTKTTGHPVPNE